MLGRLELSNGSKGCNEGTSLSFLRTKRMVRWQRGNAYDCRSYLREFDSHLNLLFALIFGG
jgi:hypothetical protein